MKIGEIAKLSGVSTRTIDYDSNSGLLAFESLKVVASLHESSDQKIT